jgi:hypothetical protein
MNQILVVSGIEFYRCWGMTRNTGNWTDSPTWPEASRKSRLSGDWLDRLRPAACLLLRLPLQRFG